MKFQKYFRTIQQQDKPLKFIFSKIMFRLKISHMFTFKHKHHILKFYPSYLSRILWVNPNHAHSGSEVEDFVWKYLRTDDIFVDIGANIGTVTLEASKKIGHNGKIFSFEANPKVFEFLKGNVNLNHSKNIELYNLALGEKTSQIYFSDIRSDESNSIKNDNQGIIVQMKTLDQIIPSNLKIELLKIDVLGYEKFVFLGAEKTLENISCIHFPAIEIKYKNYGYDYQDVFNILKSHNFLIYKMSNDGNLSLLDDNFHPKLGDYIATKNKEKFLERMNASP